MEVEELLCISHSKERMALDEVKKLDAQRRNMQCYPHTSRSKVPAFQALVVEDVKDGFSAFCQTLEASL